MPFLIKRIIANGITFLLLLSCLAGSAAVYVGPGDQIRRYTLAQEFDYVTWTLDALGLKIGQGALGLPDYLALPQQRQVVLTYLEDVDQLNQASSQIANIYADPRVKNPQQQAADLLALQKEIQQRIDTTAPLAESIVQKQVASIIAEFGLGLGGQPIPPTLYHVTPLPLALIVSPRDIIRQDADISLVPDLSVDQRIAMENKVETGLNVSALVVPVGGVGVYPTMVESTTDLNWLVETVAHEWIHNYLTLHPLGVLYDASAELRTMNETTAALAGKEIGAQVIARYYPEKVPAPVEPASQAATPQVEEPPVFDYRAEMHTTRVKADALLKEGKVQEAEAYMEGRRIFFWEHGYRIRRLNQAYFAFYGAYADIPGGAAGEDPVGGAVRLLRSQSSNLAAFVQRIAWVTSYEKLQELVQTPRG